MVSDRIRFYAAIDRAVDAVTELAKRLSGSQSFGSSDDTLSDDYIHGLNEELRNLLESVRDKSWPWLSGLSAGELRNMGVCVPAKFANDEIVTAAGLICEVDRVESSVYVLHLQWSLREPSIAFLHSPGGASS